ncbi:MAG: ELWxxDGT repeat protein [Candidatus Limnocylindrales bacterium]
MSHVLLLCALLAVAPTGSALAQDNPIDAVDGVGCGAGMPSTAGADVLRAAPGPDATAIDGPETAPITSRAAAITVIPPTAATAGISSGARGFRTTAGKRPAWLTPFLGSLVFSAVDDSRGREPWIATPITARRLKDVAPGARGSSPRDFTVYDGALYFSADDGTHGRELWKTDGTNAGTVMVRDIRRGSAGSNPGSLYVFKDRLYFVADDGVHGGELWRTNGTTSGTRLFKDISPTGGSMFPAYQGQPTGWAVMGGRLYFPAFRRVAELWSTDGTSAGTRGFVTRLYTDSNMIAAGGRLYFTGGPATGGCVAEGPYLYTSDGTRTGTIRIRAAAYPWGGMVPWRGRAWLGNHVVRGDEGVSERPRLWRSAGTERSTVQVRPAVALDAWQPMVVVGRRIFAAIGGGLAISGRTNGEMTVLGDTRDGWRATVDVVSVGDRWYFPAGEGAARELWQTGGTPRTTRLALDVNPRGNGAVQSVTAADGVIWFVGNDGIRGGQVWRYVPTR